MLTDLQLKIAKGIVTADLVMVMAQRLENQIAEAKALGANLGELDRKILALIALADEIDADVVELSMKYEEK